MRAFIKIQSVSGFSVDWHFFGQSRGEFGAIGNEAVTSDGRGEAYGFEIYAQQKLTGSVFAVVSYTFVRSRFSGVSGQLIPSAWDNRHLVSLIFGKNWVEDGSWA